MITRKATVNDIGSLTDLRIAYINEDNVTLPPEAEKTIRKQLPDYFRRRLGKELIAYIAEENGEAVSSCFLLITEKPAGPRFPDGLTGTVLNVYTKPEYRRHGLAGTLMKMLLSDAKALGLDYVELKATKDAVKLYKSLGFEEAFSKYTDMKFEL
ncbi:MAG: GNAT family N-acetyltransferase [Ruminococcus sp.]|nr:GNAT family N-acetyltransferase [Ruminococcus sp.]